MAMGKSKTQTQENFWIETSSLRNAPGHPFYQRLNDILAKHGFDRFVEEKCAKYYAPVMGRPSIPPGVYFRMLLVGYFEGIDSERGMAWRVADSLALRRFLGYALHESTPDHSSVSRTRRLVDIETHQEVFDWILTVLAKEGLLKGKTLGVDATTLEANAALRSIVRRDTGESYEEFLTGLAKASGIETPTRKDLAKLDRKRKKKTSNKDWEHPHDPDAAVAKMKDGRTHMAHKAEHAVDMETDAIVAVTLPGADEGDTDTLPWTLLQAEQNIESVSQDEEAKEKLSDKPVSETVTDKGYHSNDTLVYLEDGSIRSYVSEPDRGRRRWKGKEREQQAVYANRRRIRGRRGKALMRKRGEFLERSFAHVYDTGGMRRLHLRGRGNILKRLLVHVGGFNLGLVMRKVFGRGTPRGLAGLRQCIFDSLSSLWKRFRGGLRPTCAISGDWCRGTVLRPVA
jgi:transposase